MNFDGIIIEKKCAKCKGVLGSKIFGYQIKNSTTGAESYWSFCRKDCMNQCILEEQERQASERKLFAGEWNDGPYPKATDSKCRKCRKNLSSVIYGRRKNDHHGDWDYLWAYCSEDCAVAHTSHKPWATTIHLTLSYSIA